MKENMIKSQIESLEVPDPRSENDIFKIHAGKDLQQVKDQAVLIVRQLMLASETSVAAHCT